MYQDKLHIHIQNSRSSAPVFIATEAQVADLLVRDATRAGNLHITIGSSAEDVLDRWTDEDFADYYRHMATADLLVGYSFPTAGIESYAPSLKLVHFIASGVDHIAPFDWVPDGLLLTNNRGVHLPKSGESFHMFLLMLNAQMPRMMTSQGVGRWDRVFTSVIGGKTLVILGVGNQGGEMARQGKSLGLRVIGIDPGLSDHPHCDRVVAPEDMGDVLPEADFFAICAPLTDATRGLIGAEALALLPNHAGVINVGRGPILDARALDAALRAGALSGAILDVFDEEPLPAGHFLWSTPNLVMTPHVTSDDLVHYMPRTLDLALYNLRQITEGGRPDNLVDIHRAY